MDNYISFYVNDTEVKYSANKKTILDSFSIDNEEMKICIIESLMQSDGFVPTVKNLADRGKWPEIMALAVIGLKSKMEEAFNNS